MPEHEDRRIGDQSDDHQHGSEGPDRRPEARPRSPVGSGGVRQGSGVHRRDVGVAGVQVDRRQHGEPGGGADQPGRPERTAIGDAVDSGHQSGQHGRRDQQPGASGEHHLETYTISHTAEKAAVRTYQYRA